MYHVLEVGTICIVPPYCTGALFSQYGNAQYWAVQKKIVETGNSIDAYLTKNKCRVMVERRHV